MLYVSKDDAKNNFRTDRMGDGEFEFYLGHCFSVRFEDENDAIRLASEILYRMGVDCVDGKIIQ